MHFLPTKINKSVCQNMLTLLFPALIVNLITSELLMHSLLIMKYDTENHKNEFFYIFYFFS